MPQDEMFEGTRIAEHVYKVGGDVGDARVNVPVPYGTEVVVVMLGRVDKVTHGDAKVGLQESRHIVAVEGFVLTEEVDADDLIQKLRADRERSLRNLLGPNLLDGDGDQDS